MKQLEWFNNLQSMSDEELQVFAKSQGLKFSLKEIHKLRKLFKNASISWAFTGIPNDVLERAEKIIGKERLERLQQLLK